MPTFKKRTSAKGRSLTSVKRVFAQRKRQKTKAETLKAAEEKIQASNSSVLIEPRKKRIRKSLSSLKLDDAKDTMADIAITRDLENRFNPEEETDIKTEPVPELLIETPDRFDGISSDDERIKLMEQELEFERRRSKKLEHEISLLKHEFDKERDHLERNIKELKRELHRTTPLQDNKFFSLSKELREALDSIQDISTTTPKVDFSDLKQASKTVLPSPQPKPEQIAKAVEKKTVKKEPELAKEEKVVIEEKPPKTEKTEAVVEKKADEEKIQHDNPKKKKKKLLITGGAAVALLLITSGAFSYRLFAPPKVDESLVQEYLGGESGQVQGATTEGNSDAPAAPAPTQPLQEAQADIPYENTVWDTYKDPIFGVQIQYPKNAVNFIKTESSVTFVRKEGYLVRIQKIETALELEDYWKQVKSTSLNYVMKETEFVGRKGYHLQLEDLTDFPGDRYLIKEGNFIYDIWYATPSDRFDSDDIKRVEYMLKTFSFVS